MSNAPDNLTHEVPPLGSRCAAANCDEVPTYIELYKCDYGAYALHHKLYFCRIHLEQHRASLRRGGRSR